jgi:hypothetical protein
MVDTDVDQTGEVVIDGCGGRGRLRVLCDAPATSPEQRASPGTTDEGPAASNRGHQRVGTHRRRDHVRAGGCRSASAPTCVASTVQR